VGIDGEDESECEAHITHSLAAAKRWAEDRAKAEADA
jgi:hypothetical protein